MGVDGVDPTLEEHPDALFHLTKHDSTIAKPDNSLLVRNLKSNSISDWMPKASYKYSNDGVLSGLNKGVEGGIPKPVAVKQMPQYQIWLKNNPDFALSFIITFSVGILLMLVYMIRSQQVESGAKNDDLAANLSKTKSVPTRPGAEVFTSHSAEDRQQIEEESGDGRADEDEDVLHAEVADFSADYSACQQALVEATEALSTEKANHEKTKEFHLNEAAKREKMFDETAKELEKTKRSLSDALLQKSKENLAANKESNELKTQLAKTKALLSDSEKREKSCNEALTAATKKTLGFEAANRELQAIRAELESVRQELEKSNKESDRMASELQRTERLLSEANSTIAAESGKSAAEMALLAAELKKSAGDQTLLSAEVDRLKALIEESQSSTSNQIDKLSIELEGSRALAEDSKASAMKEMEELNLELQRTKSLLEEERKKQEMVPTAHHHGNVISIQSSSTQAVVFEKGTGKEVGADAEVEAEAPDPSDAMRVGSKEDGPTVMEVERGGEAGNDSGAVSASGFATFTSWLIPETPSATKHEAASLSAKTSPSIGSNQSGLNNNIGVDSPASTAEFPSSKEPHSTESVEMQLKEANQQIEIYRSVEASNIAMKDEIKALNDKVSTLTSDILSAEEALSQGKAANKSLEDELQQLRDHLKAHKEKANNILRSSQGDKANLETSNAALQGEIASLKNSVSSLTAELSTAKEALAKSLVEGKLKKGKKKSGESESAIQDLEDELHMLREGLQASKEEKEKFLAEQNELIALKVSAEIENESLKESLVEIRQNNSTYMLKNLSLKSEVTKYRAVVNKISKGFKRALDDAGSSRASLEDASTNSSDAEDGPVNADLAVRNLEYVYERVGAALSSAQKVLDSHRSEAEELRKRLQDVEVGFNSAIQDRDRAQEELSLLNKSRKKNDDTVGKLKRELKDLFDLRQQTETENSAMKKFLFDLFVLVRRSEEDSDRDKTDAEAFEAELSDIPALYGSFEEAFIQLQTDLFYCKVEIDRLRLLEDDSLQRREQVDRMSEELLDSLLAKNELVTAQQRIAFLESEIDKSKSSISSIKLSSKKEKSPFQEQDEKGMDMDAVIKTLEDSCLAIEADLGMAKDEINRLRGELLEKILECNDLTDELNRLKLAMMSRNASGEISGGDGLIQSPATKPVKIIGAVAIAAVEEEENSLIKFEREIVQNAAKAGLSHEALHSVCTRMAALVRGKLTRMRVRASLREIPHILSVRIRTASGLISVPAESSLFLLLNTVPNVLHRLSSQNLAEGESTLQLQEDSKFCMSSADTKAVATIDNGCSFEERIRLGMVGSGFLVLTVMQRFIFTEPTVVGQVVLDLSRYPLTDNDVIDIEVPIEQQTHTIFGYDGKAMSTAPLSVPSLPAIGSLSLSIQMPSVYSNMCGWFYDIQELNPLIKVIDVSFVNHEKMWVMLHEGVIHCYSSPYGGNRTFLRSIKRLDIASIEEFTFDRTIMPMDSLKLILHDGRELIWGWGDDSKAVKGMWKSAFSVPTRSPNLPPQREGESRQIAPALSRIVFNRNGFLRTEIKSGDSNKAKRSISSERFASKRSGDDQLEGPPEEYRSSKPDQNLTGRTRPRSLTGDKIPTPVV